MITEASNLAGTQQWLQKAIMTPWIIDSAEIESAIKSGGKISPTDRLGIYTRAYQGRLIECMENEFAVLSLALGKDLFVRFASDYLIKTPSRSYTLTALGKKFPEFLQATAPDEPWAKFIIELATFERAFCEVFHADETFSGCETIQRTTDAASAPTGSRIISSSFPIDQYFSAAREHLQDPNLANPPDFPDFNPVHVLLFRKNFVVQMKRLVETSSLS